MTLQGERRTLTASYDKLAKPYCSADCMPIPRHFFNVVEDDHKVDDREALS